MIQVQTMTTDLDKHLQTLAYKIQKFHLIFLTTLYSLKTSIKLYLMSNNNLETLNTEEDSIMKTIKNTSANTNLSLKLIVKILTKKFLYALNMKLET